jgi:hypothetical protein
MTVPARHAAAWCCCTASSHELSVAGLTRGLADFVRWLLRLN